LVASGFAALHISIKDGNSIKEPRKRTPLVVTFKLPNLSEESILPPPGCTGNGPRRKLNSERKFALNERDNRGKGEKFKVGGGSFKTGRVKGSSKTGKPYSR